MRKDKNKTKDQLISELDEMRKRIAELERFQAGFKTIEQNSLFQGINSLILNNTIMGIAFVRNRILEWGNSKFAEMFNIPWDQVQGSSTRVCYSSDREYEEKGIAEYAALGRGEWFELELDMSQINGVPFTARIVGKALDSSQPHDGSIWLFENITERKEAEKALKESEAKYRLLVDNSYDLIWTLNKDGIFTFISPSWQRMLGYGSSDIIGKRFKTIIHHDDIGACEQIFQEIRDTRQQKASIQYKVKHADGTWRWHEASCAPVFDSEGSFISAVGVSRDMTESRLALDVLLKSELTLQSVFKATPIGLCILKDQVFCNVNRIWYENLGYSESDIIGHTPRIFYENEEEYEKVSRELFEKLAESDLSSVQTRLLRKDGVVRDMILTAVPLQLEDASLRAVVTLEDVTDRKRAEQELVWKTALLEAQVEATIDGILIVDENGEIILVNQQLLDMWRVPGQVLNNKDNTSLLQYATSITKSPEYFFHKVKYLNDHPFEVSRDEIEFKDGTVLDYYTSPVMGKDGKYYGRIWTYRDVTERKHAEKELRKSKRELADIIEFLPDATLVIDKEGRVIAWNRAIEKMTGVKKEDMLGRGNHEYAVPFYGNRRKMLVDLALHPDGGIINNYTGIRRAGDILLGEALSQNLLGDVYLSGTASVLRDSSGEVVAAIECIRDNTERKKLEERLNRAEKMEALGTLAGGVAHDLNNVLGVLIGYTELLKEYLAEDSIAVEFADNILQSGVRATAIIQDMLTMARRGVAISEIVNLNDLVANYIKTPEFDNLKIRYPKVQISIKLEDSLLNIKGSPVHLAKTIMNLVSNAAESISDTGKISIKTKNRHLDQPIHGYDTMQEGDYVVLIVSDNGNGIPAKDIDKIFEPFYTKKVMGKSGTGLGLAVVWGTVKDHKGYIDVQSKEGKGATFTLYFPVTREEPAIIEKTVSYLANMGKGESILVVDDVKEQRKLAMIMLEKLGYQVSTVASGEEAIEYLKNKKVDLIVLDMIMSPGIDGYETYRRLLDINPRQKAIIVSGFSETDLVRNVQEIGAGEFVRKPYMIGKIGLAVKKELTRKHPAVKKKRA